MCRHIGPHMQDGLLEIPCIGLMRADVTQDAESIKYLIGVKELAPWASGGDGKVGRRWD